MRYSHLCIFVFGLLAQLLPAQGKLTLPSIEVSGMEIRVQCVATVDGRRVFPGQHDFEVSIDGRRVVSDISVFCRDSTEEFAGVSAALVVDMSGSMREAKGDSALEGLRAYLSSMDGRRDEATLLFFNNFVRIAHIMSPDTASLGEALQEYAPYGGGVLWDAAFAGLVELHSMGINNTRAVIVLSDGTGAISSRPAREVTELALRHRVPVYFIALPPGGDEWQMQGIADPTGGEVFVAEQLAEVPGFYREIFRRLKQEAQAKTVDTCVVISPTGCEDGREHVLEIRARLQDSLHASASATFRLPLNPASAKWTVFRLGTETGSPRGGVNIPLEVLPVFPRYPFYRAQLPPMGFDLHFDTARCHVEGAVFPANAILDTLPVSAFPIPGGVRIQLEDTASWVVPPDGSLLFLRFRLHDSADTSAIALHVSNVTVDDVCISPAMVDGSITVVPEELPRIAMHCTVDSILHSGDTARTATVRLQVWNDGAAVLRDCEALLTIDSTLQPFGGASLLKRFAPDSLPPWHAGERVPQVSWTLQYTGASWCHSQWKPVTVTVTLRDADGTPQVFRCETNVIVRGADPSQYPITYGTKNPALLCAGDSIVLDAGVGYARYLWSTGESTRSIVVHDSGKYWCDAWTSTCRVRHRDSIHVQLLTPAAIPSIERRGDTLITESGYRQYQWLRNGVIVHGYGYTRLSLDRHGSYRVRVMNENGCFATSDSILVDHLDDPLLERGAMTFTLYPVPARSYVNIRLYFFGEQECTISVYDLLGRRRREGIVYGSDRVRTILMGLDGLQTGAYVVRVRSESGSAWRMLYVE